MQEQYKTLFVSVHEFLRDSTKIQGNSDIWYWICTTPSCYEPVKDLIHFALSFLARDQNECSVESMIGDIQIVDNTNRPRLSHESATMQEFIRKNGPKPLVSWDLRKRVLNEMWPMGWHFLVAERVGKFQSTVVSSLVSEAESDDFCF